MMELLDIVNNFLLKFGDPLLDWMLKIPRDVALVILAILTAVILTIVRIWTTDQNQLKRTKEDILILAPGPINRGVEVTPDVADGPHSAILEQVSNGLAVRMAVLWLLVGPNSGPWSVNGQ